MMISPLMEKLAIPEIDADKLRAAAYIHALENMAKSGSSRALRRLERILQQVEDCAKTP
jgi:hypothetical protein